MQPWSWRGLKTHLLTDGIVLLDPGAAPGVRISPPTGVQVEDAVVDRGNLHLVGKAGAGSAAVDVEPVVDFVGHVKEALLSSGHHVIRIKTLDVLGRVFDPLEKLGVVAAFTARFIAELPTEDGRARLVALDKHLDVVTVCLLRAGVVIPRHSVAAESLEVHLDATIIIPVIDEWENELDAMSFSCRDCVVQSLKTVRAIVDVGPRLVQQLKPNLVWVGRFRRRDRTDISKSPNAGDLVANLHLAVRHV